MISQDLDKAKELLEADEIIGLPTETVYGLAGNIFSQKAVNQIYEVKKRPTFNPLIVHIKGIDQLHTVASEIPPKALALAEAFWPGPLTLVLKKHNHIPDWVTAGKPSVAVRVPAHPMALALLNKLNFPLAAPSANPFSTISPTSALHVEHYFGNKIPLILDGGECQRGIESTIVGFENDQPVLYRHGTVPLEAIEALIGPLNVKDKNNESPEAPGMLLKHYSPATPFVLTDKLEDYLENISDRRVGIIILTLGITTHSAVENCEVLSPQGDLTEAAANLYAAMHRLDKMGLDIIIAERMPEIGLGRTMNDRMNRAAYQSKK